MLKIDSIQCILSIDHKIPELIEIVFHLRDSNQPVQPISLILHFQSPLGRRCNTTASSQNDGPSVAGIPISVAPSSVARKSSTSGQHVSKQPVREVLNTFLPDVSVRKPQHFDTFLKSRSIDSKQPVRNPLHTQCHRVCDRWNQFE